MIFCALENSERLYDPATNQRFALQTAERRHKLFHDVYTRVQSGQKIIGIGAPAKASTVCNYCRLGPELVDYVTEVNPLRMGRYLPGVHIPIVDEEWMFHDPKPADAAILFAWNYYDEIVPKLRSSRFRRRDSLPVSGTILFGGSGFLGPYILSLDPAMISVGRTPPPTHNRHIPIESLANLDALRDVPFDKVIYIIGNTDHHNLEKQIVPRDEPIAFDYHVTPLLRTLEQLKQYPIKRFIHFSTILIYDEKRIELPVSERAPIDPYKNRYVLSKYMAEEALNFYRRWIPIMNVRLSNIYGPTPLERWDLIHVISRKLLRDGFAEMWSTRPERDFIHVEDAARAVIKLLDADYNGTLNLGTGTLTPVKVVKEALEQESGGTIRVLDIPVQGPAKFQCDMTTLNSLIDWKPRYSTAEGVRQTYRHLWRHTRGFSHNCQRFRRTAVP